MHKISNALMELRCSLHLSESWRSVRANRESERLSRSGAELPNIFSRRLRARPLQRGGFRANFSLRTDKDGRFDKGNGKRGGTAIVI